MISRKDSKNKFNVDLGFDDIYNHYKGYSPYPLDKKKYSKVFTEVLGEMMNLIIKDGYSLNFPHKFGKLEIQKRKQKIIYDTNGNVNRIYYKVDWLATKEHWKKIYGDLSTEELKAIKGKTRIYCKNKYRMSFKYVKDSAQYKSKSIVMFIPNRKWCRELASHLKANPYQTDYKEQ